MIILSWNVRGLGSLDRRVKVKKVIRQYKASVVLIQETKLNSSNDSLVKQISGNGYFTWVGLNANGASRGILLRWDSRKLQMLDYWVGSFSISALIRDMELNKEWIISSIYGSTVSAARGNFWRELDLIRSNWSGPWCLGGDFNIMRCLEDRLGGCHFSSDITAFYDWINSHALQDLQLHGLSSPSRTIRRILLCLD